MVIKEPNTRPTGSAARKRRTLTPQQREEKIQRLIWTFEVEGITLTREQAEKAVDRSLSNPLPKFSA